MALHSINSQSSVNMLWSFSWHYKLPWYHGKGITCTNPKSFINWTPICIIKKILSNRCHVTTFLCHQKQKQKKILLWTWQVIHHDQKHLLLWLKTTRWCHITNIPRNKGLCHQVDKEISRRLSWKFILATALHRTDIHLFSQSTQRVSRKKNQLSSMFTEILYQNESCNTCDKPSVLFPTSSFCF